MDKTHIVGKILKTADWEMRAAVRCTRCGTDVVHTQQGIAEAMKQHRREACTPTPHNDE